MILLPSRAIVGFVLLASSLASGHGPAAGSSAFVRPLSLTLSELEQGTRRAELVEALTTQGMVAVVGGSDAETTFAHRSPLRELALEQWCLCQEIMATEQEEALPSTQALYLEDGRTKRTTLASATVGETMPLALDPSLQRLCGGQAYEAMEDLRDSVNHVTRAFVQALDRLLPSASPPILHDIHGKSYATLASVVEAATHLEHFHVYEKKSPEDTPRDSADSQSKALDFHTDAGLFLVFVPGYDCRRPNSVPSGNDAFWVRDAVSGQARPVEFDPDTRAVIMLGAGAEKWLETPSLPLKATQHAVQMQPRQTRAWFGKMHLVPDHAIVQTVPTTKTFKELKASVTTTSIELATGQQDARTVQRLSSPSLGCGDVPTSDSLPSQELSPLASRDQRRRLQHVGSPNDCNNVTNFFCWYQCLEIPNPDQVDGYLNEGYSLYCLDPAVLASSGNKVSAATEPCEEGYVHNGACQGSWQPSAPGVPTTVSFQRDAAPASVEYCYGGVSMYMDGFHWVHESLCVVYLFPEWVLSSRTKLAMASLGTLLIGILLECIIWQRRKLSATLKAGTPRLLVLSLYYGLQLTLGYFVMLVVMTYSGVLFLCSVGGLVLGNVIFNAKDGVLAKLSSPAKNTADLEFEALPGACACADGKTSVGVEDVRNDDQPDVPDGATPCCQNGI